jgi:virulence-associated protein VagC
MAAKRRVWLMLAQRSGSCSDFNSNEAAVPYFFYRRKNWTDRNQAVRLPLEFELPGKDAVIRKEGDKLITELAPPKSLLTLLAPLEKDFPPDPRCSP